MNNDTVIKQDSPNNILWRLFRIFVEETEVPADVHQNVTKTLGVVVDEH